MNTMESALVQTLASALSNLGSLYLGYILYFVLEDLCVVCVSSYIINIGILFCNIVKLKYFKQLEKKKAK